MKKVRLPIVAVIASASILSACSGGLDQQPLFGEISFEGWAGSVIGGATLWLRVYEQGAAGTTGPLVTEYTERGVNMDPVQTPPVHPFATNVPPLETGSTYLIEVHIDIDLDGVPSSGDAVTAEPFPFVAKDTLDPAIIQVVIVP